MLASAILAWSAVVPQRLQAAQTKPRPAVARPAFAVGASLPSWRFGQFRAEALAGITDLTVFGVMPTSRGEIDLLDLSSEALAKVRLAKTKHRFRSWITVGGWGRSLGFPTSLRTGAMRRQLLEELAFFMQKEGFDGADFDWEHPKTAQEIADYAAFLTEAKAFFGPRRKLVSVSLPAWLNLPSSIWRDVDRINLMAYDHEGRHATVENAFRDVDSLVARGASARKIHVAVPFYGRSLTDWTVAMGYGEIVRQFSPAPDADEAGGFYFNGPATIRRKVDEARTRGLGGVMAWEIGQDATGEQSLLRAMVSAAGTPVSANSTRQPNPDPRPVRGTVTKGEKSNKVGKKTAGARSGTRSGARTGARRSN